MRIAIGALLVAASAGCMEDSADAPSPVVHPHLEISTDLSQRIDGVDWELDADGTLLVDGDTPLPVPGAITLVRSRRVGEFPGVWIGYRDADGDWHLAAAADTDGDRVLEAATLRTLVSSGRPLVVTDLYVHEERVFLLDRRCQDLYVLTDTDADGLPDAIGARPFARAADHVDLLVAERFFDAGADFVDVVATRGGGNHRLSPYRTHYGEVTRLEDDDGDGIAERAVTWRRTSGVPSLRGRPVEGRSTFRVRALHGATAELWTLKSGRLGYERDVRLGSVRGTGEWAVLTTSRPVVRGEVLGTCYRDEEEILHFTVRADGPQILGLRGNLVTSGGRLVLHGLGFDANTVVRLRTGPNYATRTPLPATFVSDERLEVTYGALDPSLEGGALVEVERVVHGTPRTAIVATRVIGP